jgi:hypothetical protein
MNLAVFLNMLNKTVVMKTLGMLVSTLTLFGFIMCSSTKNTIASENNATSQTAARKAQEKDMSSFTKGTIVAHKEPNSTCSFYVVIESNDEKLDPINLKKEFKTDQAKVWFTFNRLRMANRCNNIKPISLTDIKKREE